MKKFYLPLVLITLILTGCPGGGSGSLFVDSIKGSAYVNENESVEYTIEAYGDTGITYLWAIDPSDAGTFTGQETSAFIFYPHEVDEDTPVAIMVTVSADNSGGEFRRTDIMVRDGASDALNVSQIDGPSTVYDTETVVYSVDVSGDTGITYEWEVEPSSIGILGSADSDEVEFTASNVDDPVDGLIRVTVDSDNYDLEIRELPISVVEMGGGWAQTWGTENYCDAMDSVVTENGSIIVVGAFVENADLDPGPGEDIHSAPLVNCYVSRFTPQGDYVWGVSMQPSGSLWGENVALDDSGNIYVTGMFHDTVDFDPGPGVFELTSTILDYSFILSLDNGGNFRWAVMLGDEDTLYEIHDIVITPSGDILTTGTFGKQMDFDPSDSGEYPLVSVGGKDFFVSVFDANGNWQWAVRVGSVGTDDAYSIDTDLSGNIYIAGRFEGIVDFDPSPGVLDKALRESHGTWDSFVLSLTSIGEYRWAQTWGGPDLDYTSCVALSSSGDVIAGGAFIGTVDFDPDPLDVDEISSVAGRDVHLSVFDSSGDYKWTRTWDGENIISLGVDSDLNIIAGGTYTKSGVDFDPGPDTLYSGHEGHSDISISKFDHDGNLIWLNTFGGSGQELFGSVQVGITGEIYVTGLFHYTFDFQPGPETDEHTDVGGFGSAFLLKYLPDGSW